MKSDELKSRVFSRGTVYLKSGVFQISQWVQNFNPNFQRQMNSQVWVRLFELSMEYWEPAFLMGIAGAKGEPLKIDDSLRKEFGTYARRLVDINFAKPLPEDILIQRVRFEFMTYVGYENLPEFCEHCQAVGHSYSQLLNDEGRRSGRQEQSHTQERTQQNQEFRRRTNQNNDRTQRIEVVSEEETEEQLHNTALNVILQSYDQLSSLTTKEPLQKTLFLGRTRQRMQMIPILCPMFQRLPGMT